MSIKKLKSQSTNRNAFIALCEKADQESWCWAINCTTCRHQNFEIGFSKIIDGEHPDSPSFSSKITDGLNPGPISPQGQMRLAEIIADAKLTDIQSVAVFPNWLHYIGLAIHRCPEKEARKIISDSLVPQLIEYAISYPEIVNLLKGKQARGKILAINDLGKIQNSLQTSTQK